jgi:hypothetical protein
LARNYFGRKNSSVNSYEAALCGSFSGAIAAAVTTPLDVLKTRLMLGKVFYSFLLFFSFKMNIIISSKTYFYYNNFFF